MESTKTAEGMEVETDTQVAWSYILQLKTRYSFEDDIEAQVVLGADPENVDIAEDIINYLRLDTKRSNPALSVISSGMRSVPTGEFRKKLDTWNRVKQKWGMLALQEDQTFKKGTMVVDNDNVIDEIVDAEGKTWILEHFFECRFAGALLVRATGRECLSPANGDDETFAMALTVLRAIINHKCNLTWTTEELNKDKTRFFGGHAVDDMSRSIALFSYMRQASFKFKRVVSTTQKALSDKGMLKDVTTLSRMLELLLASPFCQPHKSDDYEQWMPYVDLVPQLDLIGSKIVQLKSASN